MSGSGSTYYVINGLFEKLDGYWLKNNLYAVNEGIKKVPL